MKKTLITIMLLLAAASLSVAQNKTYFVSPSGNDSSDGLSVKTAWKSIDKVNAATFQAGDKVLFEGGQTFYGNIVIKSSGTAENPIVFSGFGCGKPVINIGGKEGTAITIQNADGIEIIGFEITSGFPPEVGVGRNGILIDENTEGKAFNHIVIKDNFIHDIWGQMGGTRIRNAAISGGVTRPWRPDEQRGELSTLEDVLIEGNRIERVDKVGISTNGIGKLRVRRNYMDNLGGDGIIVGGSYRALIEFNEIHRSCMRSGNLYLPGDTGWENGGDGWWPHTAACWIIRCEETIMQFNEVYDTGREVRNGDGFAYDFDFYCKRCLAQYNYSKENHGFLLLMYDIFQNVARYNISENDKTHLVQMQGSLKNDGNVLYNNVFYVDHGLLDLDFFRGDFLESAKDIDDLGAHFYNNIFYATGQGRFRTAYSTGYAWDRTFDETLKPDLPAGSLFLNNCYYGPWKNGLPDDPKAIVADPEFVNPGTGGTGFCTLGGYRLRPESPCINAGMYIPSAGGRDFFGQPLSDGHPDVGAFEFLGSGVFADEAALAAQDADASDASAVAWAKWCFPLELGVENTTDIKIRLYQPLEDGVTGTVSWTNPATGKTVKADIPTKTGDRTEFTLKAKTDAQTLLGSKVKVSVNRGKYVEEWEIPFAEKPARRK
jgi:hypothetical protein